MRGLFASACDPIKSSKQKQLRLLPVIGPSAPAAM